MNEELFRGVAALRWCVAREHLSSLAPSDPRRRLLRDITLRRMGGNYDPAPPLPPGPPFRQSFKERLASPDGGLALYLESRDLPRRYIHLPAGELPCLNRLDIRALMADRGECRGVPFISARVFDLRGLPPADGAELYGREPALTEPERLSLRMSPVRPPGTPTPEAVERKIRNGKRESLLQFLRDGELLATGVAEGEREPVPAAEWPQEVGAITEAFATGRLGRWRDLLVRAPSLPAATPPAVEATSEVPVHVPEWTKRQGEIGRYLKSLVDGSRSTVTKTFCKVEIGKRFPGTPDGTFKRAWSELTDDPAYEWLKKPGPKAKRRLSSIDKSAPNEKG